MSVNEFEKNANFHEDISWASVGSCVSLWVSNKSQFLRRHILGLSLKLRKFMIFKPKPILLKTFAASQFEVIYVSEFQTKANSYEDIFWVSVWSYVSLWIWNQSEFSWRHSWSLSLKLYKFMSWKQKWILMKAFVESQIEVIYFYEFQTRANSDEDICWVLVWSYLSWQVWNKAEFLWRHLFSLSLKFCKFMSFKQKWILMKTFAESQFELM